MSFINTVVLVTLCGLLSVSVAEGVATPLQKPAPPASLSGSQASNRFPVEEELFNVLKWRPSPSKNVTAYKVRKDGKWIATLSNKVLKFIDHNCVEGEFYEYQVVAVSSEGVTSVPKYIRIPQEG